MRRGSGKSRAIRRDEEGDPIRCPVVTRRVQLISSTLLHTISRMTRLPLVRIPGGTTIYRLGAGNLDARSALLRFGQKGWTISQSTVDSSGRTTEGWAIVGDAEGRRLAVEVRSNVFVASDHTDSTKQTSNPPCSTIPRSFPARHSSPQTNPLYLH